MKAYGRFATKSFRYKVVSLQVDSLHLKSFRYTAKVISLQPDNLSEFIQVKQSTKMAARKQCLLVSNYHVNRHAVAPTCDFFTQLLIEYE